MCAKLKILALVVPETLFWAPKSKVRHAPFKDELLSTHADSHGCRLLFLCVMVGTVTDFSAEEDKASDVKFCTPVHRRPRL